MVCSVSEKGVNVLLQGSALGTVRDAGIVKIGACWFQSEFLGCFLGGMDLRHCFPRRYHPLFESFRAMALRLVRMKQYESRGVDY